MKRNPLFTLLLVLVFPACGSKHEPAPPPPPQSKYVFAPVKDIPALPVTSQHGGTCWSFATTSLLESEIIRLKGEKIKLSEMYFVRCAYMSKAQNYILRQGTARFSEGGLSHDPVLSAAEFGIIPESGYTGIPDGATARNYDKMFGELERTVKKYTPPAEKPGAAWRAELPAVLDRFLGTVPARFQYDGKSYTPASFLAYTHLHLDDYVTITSFTHVPFYKPFVMSIPANWANERFYNLPLDEFIENIDHALGEGYSLSLDIDGSEPSFTAELGVIPEKKEDEKIILTEIRPEKKITQEMRQDAFENFSTTDDHLVHITGLAKDQQGNIYYKTKNSWGPRAGREGFIYLSVAYMRMKGISVMLHKDGLIGATAGKLFNKPESPEMAVLR